MLSEGPKIGGVGRHKKVEGLLNGKVLLLVLLKHGLRTPNEGINQRNLKFWADVADNICFGLT